jgi:hypothetical protein
MIFRSALTTKLTQQMALTETAVNRKMWMILAMSLLICASVGIFLVARLYPFVDLPHHLATATIYKEIHSGSSTLFNRFFTVRSVFPEANVIHLIFTGSSLFPSVEFANRVFYLVYVVAFPISILC